LGGRYLAFRVRSENPGDGEERDQGESMGAHIDI